MDDFAERRRLNMWIDKPLLDAAEKAGNALSLGLSAYVRLAVHERLKRDGVEVVLPQPRKRGRPKGS